jgi:hypothetical protein
MIDVGIFSSSLQYIVYSIVYYIERTLLESPSQHRSPKGAGIAGLQVRIAWRL